MTAPGPGTPGLNAFEYSRAHAYELLGDALDEICGWNKTDGLTAAQAEALVDARRYIRSAKDMLNEAAR